MGKWHSVTALGNLLAEQADQGSAASSDNLTAADQEGMAQHL
jgi:hypothetical protein